MEMPAPDLESIFLTTLLPLAPTTVPQRHMREMEYTAKLVRASDRDRWSSVMLVAHRTQSQGGLAVLAWGPVVLIRVVGTSLLVFAFYTWP